MIYRFDKINHSFLLNIDWEKINSYSPQVYMYHSDNDPSVDKDYAIKTSKNIPGSRITIIKQAGHFNEDSGYKEFLQLLEDITSLL